MYQDFSSLLVKVEEVRYTVVGGLGYEISKRGKFSVRHVIGRLKKSGLGVVAN